MRATVSVPTHRERAGPMSQEKPLSQEDKIAGSDEADSAPALQTALCLIRKTLHSAQALPPPPDLSLPERECGHPVLGMPGLGRAVILGLFTFGIFMIFGPRKTPTCWKLFRVIHCWGFSSSPSAFSSFRWKKNLLVISHDL